MLIRFLLLLSLLICKIEASDLSEVLFNSSRGPSQPVLDVLERNGVSHDGSWECIIAKTQSQWLQTGNRWEFKPLDDPSPEQTYSLFSKLGMTQSISNEKCCYDYAIVLGTTVQYVRQRFLFLKKAWEQGVRFKQLVILTGDRPLSEHELEMIDSGDGATKNETEMMKLVFEQLDLPEEWRSMPIVFVDTPRPPGTKRPTTVDTFLYWLKSNPPPGRALITSTQPFTGRQDATARKHLPSTFEIETIGEGVNFEFYQSVPQGKAILLDELARWIYETTAADSSWRRSPCLYER